MANEQIPQPISGTAAADLSSSQYYGAKINSSGNIALCSVEGEAPIGVVANKPESGQAATVHVGGVVKAVAGGVIAAGAAVMVGSDGRFLTLDAASKSCVGRALTAAAAAGVVFELLLTHEGMAEPDTGGMFSDIVTITAAELIALDATPKVLVDFSAEVAAGRAAADDILIYEGSVLNIYDGSANYDQNQNSIVKYQTAGGGASVSLTLANFFNAGAAGKASTLKPIATDVALEANQDLVLTSSASPKNAAGDRLCQVEVYWRVYTPAS